MNPPLLLLHGALGAAEQFQPMTPLLSGDSDLHAFDLPGHGASQTDAPFRIETFAAAALDYLDSHGIGQCDIFGYSMGGYVALLLAHQHPDRVRRVITLGTRFPWSPEVAEREQKMLNADTIASKVPGFAAALDERHTGIGWRQVLARTADLLADLGTRNPLWHALPDIMQPVRVMVGDRDTTAGVEETAAAFLRLPADTRQLQVLPATPHPLEKVAPDRVAAAIRDVLS